MKYLMESDDLKTVLLEEVSAETQNIKEEKLRIFPYPKKPGITMENNSYVSYQVKFITNEKNNRFMDMVVTFWAITPMEQVDTKWNVNRHDLISSIIESIFVGTSKMGFGVSVEETKEVVMDDRYLCRILTLNYPSLNSSY